ncbi:MAG: tetratricopeptide repeat protein [Thermoanaerobaculia bacterium]
MRFRTFLGVLLAVVAALAVSYISNLNTDLLAAPFAVTPTRSVSLAAALLVAFLLGFLPTVAALLTQTLKKDLAGRRARRRERQAKSLDHSFRRAVDYQCDGLWGKASTELENLLAERPEDFSTLLRYGEVLRCQGRFEEAVEVHRRASVLYPRSVAVLYQLADDYVALGETEVAEQIHDRILRDFSGQGLRCWRRRRNEQLSQFDWREAMRTQEKIEALVGESGDSVSLDKENAVRTGLNYQRAVARLEEDRTEEADELLDGILEGEPRFVPALILRGEVERVRDDPDAAVAAWRHGFEVTGSPIFLLRIEDHFIEKQQPLEAISTLHALREVGESDLLPRFFLGRLYYRLEMHEEAHKALESLAEPLESSPSFHYLMGRVHQRRSEVALAMASYLNSIQSSGSTLGEFVCRACNEHTGDWRDRCESCGSWNSVELDFSEEAFSADELGVRLAPAHVVYDRRWQTNDS